LRAGAVALSEQRAAKCNRPFADSGLSPVKARMAAMSACSSHSIASARRRNIVIFGQLGLAVIKAWKRA
jgi:hypothetical protein